MTELEQRFSTARSVADAAAETALGLFAQHDQLVIEAKGAQDWVSNADRQVETEIRDALLAKFPNDSIVGEEHDKVIGSSDYTWVIDPIDGTTSFVNAMPGWCVVIACVYKAETVIAVIVDPIAKEHYCARKGGIATVNDKPLHASSADSLSQGSVAVGHCARHDPEVVLQMLKSLVEQGGIFYRISSGALMLSYVAAGRLLGYVEPHMNAWDCLAGLFLIEQAGGQILSYEMDDMLANGGKIIAAAPELYEQISRLELATS